MKEIAYDLLNKKAYIMENPKYSLHKINKNILAYYMATHKLEKTYQSQDGTWIWFKAEQIINNKPTAFATK